MAATLTDWLRNLRSRWNDPDTATDADLLRRFGTDRDEEAFAALVSRHGPMVFGVCRRVLGHGADAEDAFQAVFVILSVKADAVASIGKVGAWLHGVAFHTARKALSRRGLRHADSADLTDLIPARIDHHDPDADHLREKLDEVLAGLPAKYREAVVLCELEQVSRAEASARLGWTEGTLSGRLARARKLLADRLSRRGVTVGGATLAAVLSTRPLTASVPGTLVASTLNVAKLVRGGLPLPVGLATLTHGVTRAMFLNRLKLTAAALVGAGLLATGIGSLWAVDRAPLHNLATPQATFAVVADNAPKEVGPWKVKYTLAHTEGVSAVAFGAGTIATGDDIGNVIWWDATTAKEKEKLIDVVKYNIPKRAPINSLAFNPDSTWLYMTNMDSSAIHACRLDPKKRNFPGFGGNDTFRAFGFAPDGEHFLYAMGKDVMIFKNRFPDNFIEGQTQGVYKHDADVTLALITPDNEMVITATEGVLYGWDAAKQKLLWTTPTPKLGAIALAISPDSKLLAVAGDDTTVRLFDAKTGKEAATLKGHARSVAAVTFSPDGKRVASAGDDNTVRIWDTAVHKTIATLKGHTDAVKSVAFSPDGSMLVSGSADKTAKVWQLAK